MKNLPSDLNLSYNQFTGAARDTFEKGNAKMHAFLEEKVHCPKQPGIPCDPSMIQTFAASVKYAQLKKKADYAALCSGWKSESLSDINEVGRIFYLSVPPFAYENLAKTIHDVCRPPMADVDAKINSGSWLRVAFEKPFGSDLASAEVMAQQLATNLNEDEIYRFDHYLGKVGVQQISQFRKATKNMYAPLWNAQHIQRVDIVMTETEDCEGRTNFYDEYGVVRDIHQNHLTEVLSLVAMDIDTEDSPSAVLASKAALLSAIRPMTPRDIVLGQYDRYLQHARNDRHNESYATEVPTLALARLEIDNERWRGVPFYIVAGKQLSERRAYVTIHFKRPVNEDFNSWLLTFHIQGGNRANPATFVGQALPQPDLEGKLSNWHLDPVNVDGYWVPPSTGSSFSVEPTPDRPYDLLVWNMLEGQQDSFVGTDGLLAAWRFWEPVLNIGVRPKGYGGKFAGIIYPARTTLGPILADFVRSFGSNMYDHNEL